ncbi:uncharacterized protein LOC142224149 [Haematobia irritans]|uniref:uncharacterized protein LOC142224149 n=1 Tax=Haematobia irritans TaxID=7368 RepID=UPI003F501602
MKINLIYMRIIYIVFVMVTSYVLTEGLDYEFECFRCSGHDCDKEETTEIVNCYDLKRFQEKFHHHQLDPMSLMYLPSRIITPIPVAADIHTSERIILTRTRTTTTTTISTSATCPTSNPTILPTTTPTTTRTTPENPPIDNVYYDCYSMVYKDGTEIQIQKGCTIRNDRLPNCTDVSLPVNAISLFCEVCSEPKCNETASSAKAKISMIAMIATLIIRSSFV